MRALISQSIETSRPRPADILQLWALLGGLVKDDSAVKRTFANIPCHDGFEARRRIAEPVNKDTAVFQRDWLSKITNQARLQS